MNPRLQEILNRADQVISGNGGPVEPYDGPLHVGVDLGTAYTTMVVLNDDMMPIAGCWRPAQVVRDGLVLDFFGATQIVREFKEKVEARLGRTLVSAATAYPPGVPEKEVRAQGNVLFSAGLECSGLIDEASAASNVLQIPAGAVVDVGGGTTGIAIIENNKVIFTADEATGGTHFNLVIAGALGISFEEAEKRKTDPALQTELFPIVEPVMEKVGAVIAKYIASYHVDVIYMVGGTSRFPRIAEVVENFTGVKTVIPGEPLFVTPIGIAMHNN